jgi:hypothetical protein
MNRHFVREFEVVSGTFLASILVDTIGIFQAVLTGCATASLGMLALFALVLFNRRAPRVDATGPSEKLAS